MITPLQSQPTSPLSWKLTGATSQASGNSPYTQKKQQPTKTPLLEEFVYLPEFVLVSTIVLIGSVLPNWCLGVTLFYYFIFLFVTRENYSGESQRKLAYRDLTLARLQRQYVSMPLRHYAITPLRHYAIMPLGQCASVPVRQYASMPVCQYTSTPVRQYTSMPVCQYASMPVCQYAGMPVRQYASTPVRQYASCINLNTLLWHNNHEAIVPKP
jgi:hypothetical protein